MKRTLMYFSASLLCIGLAAGCSTPATGGPVSNTSNRATQTANANVTGSGAGGNAANQVGNTIGNAANASSAGSNNTSGESGSSTPMSATLMPSGTSVPKPSVGNDSAKTPYGVISFSVPKQTITKHGISVYISSGGTRHALYTFGNQPFEQVVSWQHEGKYLLVRFGEPPSANPTTSDYGYSDAVIDLSSRHVVTKSVADVQSTDYLAGSYFVQSNSATASGTPEEFISVTALTTGKHISFQLPANWTSPGVVANGKVYYAVENSRQKQVLEIALPGTIWEAAGTQTKPIVLPSSGQPHVTLESVQATSKDSIILTLTHGDMQKTYENPKLSNGVFTVTLANVSTASGVALNTTHTANDISYVLSHNGPDLRLTVHFNTAPSSFSTGIGGGDMIEFNFE